VIGDRRTFERAAAWVDAAGLAYDVVTDPAQGMYEVGTVTLLDLATAPPDGYAVGKVTADAGQVAVECATRAMEIVHTQAIHSMTISMATRA
jgi:4-hydroxy-L-threonine phosphate dehydrogenase PdxA